MSVMVADRAVQILGGYGYIRDYPVELYPAQRAGIWSHGRDRHRNSFWEMFA